MAAASRGSFRARLGKISRALGSTARAGKSASSSEANTATGPPKPELLLGGLPGRSASSLRCRRAAPSCRTAGPSALLGICEQCHCRAPQTLLGGTEAVEERGGADLEEDPQEGACSYARRETSAALQTRSGATPMVLMAMAAP